MKQFKCSDCGEILENDVAANRHWNEKGHRSKQIEESE
jgi:transcription initiation factor IIE alpha subunit